LPDLALTEGVGSPQAIWGAKVASPNLLG